MSRCERTAALAPRRRHGRIDDDRLTLRTRAIVARRYRKEERENEELVTLALKPQVIGGYALSPYLRRGVSLKSDSVRRTRACRR